MYEMIVQGLKISLAGSTGKETLFIIASKRAVSDNELPLNRRRIRNILITRKTATLIMINRVTGFPLRILAFISSTKDWP